MKKSTAFVFPGQGSQSVGMGRALTACRSACEVFEEVDQTLEFGLSRLMWEGPQETLNLTEHAQPALMAVSLAVIRVLERDFGVDLEASAVFVAGHSLGEYSALTAVGSFSLSRAAMLLRLRGQAMQEAVPPGEGAMVALLGADYDTACALAGDVAHGEVCVAANDNGPGQVVLSGHKAAVGRALEAASDWGIKRAVLLPVSAPFHCPLMAPAARRMAEALEGVSIAPPAVPVVANVSALPVQDPEEIRKALVEQVTRQVRWRESVLYMQEKGVRRLVEVGAGRVLSGLGRRIDSTLETLSLGAPEDIEVFAQSL